jgi:AAHS family 4-hydroxybenzoate transporter-like MFS transporter
LRRRVARLLPGGTITPGTRLVLRNQASRRFSVGTLFQGSLRLATILLWIAFFAEALTFITLLAWQTVMLESAGVTPVEASLAFSYSGLASIVAVLVMSRLLDRFGMTAAVGAAFATMAAFVAFGTPGLSPGLLVAIAVLMNGLAAATHNSLNGLVGAYYPTSIRGNAVGFATGMGRISGIIGPVTALYRRRRCVLGTGPALSHESHRGRRRRRCGGHAIPKSTTAGASNLNRPPWRLM